MNDEYKKEHVCCPECGSKSVETTCGGYMNKDENEANCGCGWKGTVGDMISNKKYGDDSADSILARREARQKDKEEKDKLKVLEQTHDETDCRFWSVDTTVQYFMWVLQKKTPDEIEEIVSKLIDNIKG